MFNKKYFILLVLVFIGLFAFGFLTSGRKAATPPAENGQGGAPAVELANEAEMLMMLTASNSGITFEISKAFVDALAETGYKTAVKVTGGSRQNMEGLLNGAGQFTIVNSERALKAYANVGDYADMPNSQDMKALMSMWRNYWHIIVKSDSGIESVYDLAGKRIAVDERRSDAYRALSAVFSSCEIAFSDEFLVYKSVGDALNELKQGKCDAVFMVGMLQGDRTQALGKADFDIKLVPIDPDSFAKISAENPYYIYSVLPANAYGFLSYDVPTVSTVNLMLVSPNVSKDVVYDILKKLDAQKEAFAGKYALLKNTVFGDDWAFESGLPFHAGAAEYYADVMAADVAVAE